MYLKQIIILSVFEIVILAPEITSGFELVSTTTERDVNKDSRCQQEIIKSFRNTLQEQQNFWINFYNDSCESRQTLKEQLFAKKMEEANAEFGKKQKELIQHFDKKIEETEAKYANIQQMLKQIEDKIEKKTLQETVQLFDKKLKEANAEFGKKQKELFEIIVNKQNNLLQKLEKIEAKFENVQVRVEEKSTSSLEKIESGKKSLPKNCREILEKNATLSDGVYTIQPSQHSSSFEVRCNMHTRGGGWTYVLNRFDGSQDFYLDWEHYRNGFGNLSGEFWLGLQHLYELTGFQDNYLLIELVDWDNKHYHAMYNVFRIGSEQEGYPIKALDGFSGDAGDSLEYHKNMKFSTYDRDQDQNVGNCAIGRHGAWWYNSCYSSNLAGTYFNTSNYDIQGMVWYDLKKRYVGLKEVNMMVKPYSY